MFDVGFWEVALIGVIALLVVGPERLPKLARNVGLWVGRIRRYVSHVKQDIEREIHADEMRELIKNPGSMDNELGELRDVAKETASAVEDMRRGLNEAARESEKTDEGLDVEAAKQPVSAAQQPSIPHHAVDEDPFADPSPVIPPPDHESAAVVEQSDASAESGRDAGPSVAPSAVEDDQAVQSTRRE